MKCRFLGIAWVVFVVGAIGCGATDTVPDAVSGSAPLSDEEILSVPAPTLEEYAKAYEEVLNQNPALDPESNEFARFVLEKIKEATSRSTPDEVGLQDSKVLGLTKAEWLLVNRNPWKAFLTYGTTLMAESRALIDVGSGLFQGKADAFRHAYWNVLMAKCCGLDWARDFATAHESESTDPDDTTMDLNNNEVGRRIFRIYPESSNDEHALLIKGSLVQCMRSGVTYDPNRLVYMNPCPTITVVDQGPDLGDVVEVVLDGASLGDTPPGGTRVFETKNLRSGFHSLTLICKVGRLYGSFCSFEMRLSEGMSFVDDSDHWSHPIPTGISFDTTIFVDPLAR